MKKFILVLLLIGACKAAQWPAKLTIDSEHKEEIQQYVMDLNAYFTPTLVGSDDDTHYKISMTNFGLPSPTLGIAMPGKNDCSIIISSELFEPEFHGSLKSVVWHEIGHCAGLDHSPNANDIMYYAASDFSLYSKAAIQRFVQAVSDVLNKQEE